MRPLQLRAVQATGVGLISFKRVREFWLRPRGFESLFPIDNWTGCLAAILAGLVISFLMFGFWWPYWRAADMDMFMVYEGFLFNDGLPQEGFDHPGYLSILLLGGWFRLLHAANLLDIHALSRLPPPADAAEAWMHAVQAGRVLSLILAVIFVAVFAALLRRLTGNWRVAIAGAFALAFSGGLAMEARIIRTELLCSGLLVTALLILIIAARDTRTPWRPALVGLSAFLATLALTNKVQAIFLICALPLLVLPFGIASDDPRGFWRASRLALPATALFAACAIALAIPASALVEFGLSAVNTSIVPLHPLVGNLFGWYQPIIAVWIVLAMCAFAVLWRVPPLETLAAIAAVAGGFALGLLSLDIRYHPQDVIEVMNPLEQMTVWASASDPGLATGGGVLGGSLLLSLIAGAADVLARLTFVLHSSARPTIFVEWFVIARTIFALKRGERRLALQVSLIMLVVWGVDTVGTLRGLKYSYALFTDPLIVLAAVLLLAQLVGLQNHRWVFQIGVLLIAVHLLVSHAEPVKYTLARSKPFHFCIEHFEYTKRVERYPFCPSPSASLQ
jgi:hypothetical protein